MLLEWLIWLWGLMVLEQRHCFIHTLVVPPKGHEQVMQTSMGAYNPGQGLGHADLNVYKPEYLYNSKTPENFNSGCLSALCECKERGHSVLNVLGPLSERWQSVCYILLFGARAVVSPLLWFPTAHTTPRADLARSVSKRLF
eukprot:652620-Amphidinium_carterae.1